MAVDVDDENDQVAAKEIDRNAFQELVHHAQTTSRDWWKEHTSCVIRVVLVVLLVLYLAYFVYAMTYEFGSEESVRLLWYTVLLVFGIAFHFFWKYFGEAVTSACEPCTSVLSKHGRVISW